MSGDEVDKENDFFYGTVVGVGQRKERSETCKAFENILKGPREMPREMPSEPRRTVGGLRLLSEAGRKDSRREEGFYDENGFLKE